MDDDKNYILEAGASMEEADYRLYFKDYDKACEVLSLIKTKFGWAYITEFDYSDDEDEEEECTQQING